MISMHENDPDMKTMQEKTCSEVQNTDKEKVIWLESTSFYTFY